MIDKALQERCRRLVDAATTERRKQVNDEISSIHSKAAARGMMRSGFVYSQIYSLLGRELEIRTTIAWQDLVRVHKILGSTNNESLRDDLKAELSTYTDEAYQELSTILKNQLKDAPPTTQSQLNLDQTKVDSFSKHDIEIDLYVDSLDISQSAESDNQQQSSQYNFYGNIGAVQTGANATANVVQNLSTDDKEAVVSALNAVKDVLHNLQDISTVKQKELVEIVEECVAISTSSNPNNTKLLTLLTIVGITVQSYASAQPAYNALKSVLIPLGIILP